MARIEQRPIVFGVTTLIEQFQKREDALKDNGKLRIPFRDNDVLYLVSLERDTTSQRVFIDVEQQFPERKWSHITLLRLGGQLDERGNLIGLCGNEFTARIPLGKESLYLAKYQINPKRKELACLTSITQITKQEQRKIPLPEILKTGLTPQGFPLTVNWVETFIRLITLKQLQPGMPREADKIRRAARYLPALGVDSFSTKLLAPAS